MSTDRRAVRVLQQHTDLGEDTYHEWWMPGETRYRDALSRPGGLRRWHVLRCNNPDCSGEAVVSERALLAAIAPLLPPVGGSDE